MKNNKSGIGPLTACLTSAVLWVGTCWGAGMALPVTDGLDFSLDAQDTSAFVTNDDGYITSWSASQGTAISFAQSAEGNNGHPFYDATAFGGRGAVIFGFLKDMDTDNWTVLVGDRATANRTVFLVYHPYLTSHYSIISAAKRDSAKFHAFYGKSGAAQGLDCDWYGRFQNNNSTYGGSVWWNGEAVTTPESASSVLLPLGAGAGDSRICQPTILAAELSADKANALNGITALGWFGQNHSAFNGIRLFHGAMAQVLVYNRTLSDNERNQIYTYLKFRWIEEYPLVDDGTTVTHASAGTTVFLASGQYDASRTLDIACGTLDLNGTTQTFAKVKGAGRLVNNASERAVLVIDGDEDSELFFDVGDNIDIVKRGVGELKVSAFHDYAGRTVLEGGKLTAVSNVVPSSIAGCVLHLDASVAASVVRDAQNRVSQWRAVCGGAVFSERGQGDDHKPVYGAAAMGSGLPGIAFGSAAMSLRGDENEQYSVISSDTVLSNRTVLVVNIPAANTETSGSVWFKGFYGKWGSGSWGLRTFANFDSMWCGPGQDAIQDGGWGAINGGVQSDATWTDKTPDHLRYTPGKPQLISVVGSQSNMDAGRLKYMPSIGAFEMTSRYYSGVVAEIVVFDRVLDGNLLELLEKQLMAKWGIAPASEVSQGNMGPYPELTPTETDTLPSASELVVKGPATLDFGCMDQTIEAVTFMPFNGEYPCLTVNGAWNLSSTALALEGSGHISDLMVSDVDAFSGDFVSRTGTGVGRITVSPRKVGCPGGTVILLR